jgi:diacylglycerol O-acyltransferase
MPRQRLFNLVVTNVPGPQFPLYLLGREMLEVYPLVPLAQRQGLGVAIMSYNGRINFGLNADYDAVPDLDVVAGAFEDSLHALAGAAGVTLAGRRSRRPKARSGGQGRFQAASPAQGPAG